MNPTALDRHITGNWGEDAIEKPEPMDNADLYYTIRARAALCRTENDKTTIVFNNLSDLIASEVRSMDEYRLNNFLKFLTEQGEETK